MCKINIPEGATLDERRSICFDTLYKMNLNDKVEKKDNLTYLSWSEAWKAFKEVYPSATFRVISNPDTKLPFFVDANVGIMVFTEVTADDLTYQMFLPVMNSANRAMKLQPYNYQVWDKRSNRYVERTCEAASMFDVNKAIMRCLVKNISLFGLGLYIYQGEDIPNDTSEDAATNTADTKKTTTRRAKTVAAPVSPQPTQPVDRFAPIKNAINSVADTDALLDLYLQHQPEVEGNPEIKALFTERKLQLKQAA
ncbi:MAG: DUF1071 domain-containing protein [Bacteroidaceae bacterium]|nr:DUF1071 domain-containing protein [Bacteroidaceae bacterium]